MIKEQQPVWVWMPGATTPVQAGWLQILPDKSGRFIYTKEYLDAKGRSLDPLELSFRSWQNPTAIPAGNREGIPGIIADAGPDSWGRKALEEDLGFQPNALEALVHAVDDGVGAIAVGDLSKKPPLEPLNLLQLATAIEARLQGQHVNIPREVERILSPDTALGGAKPKATIIRDGMPWIAKFTEKSDPPHLAYLEAAAMHMAAKLGIFLVEPVVEPLPDGRAALLLPRFDREKTSDGGTARRGFASALTVLGPEAQVAGKHRSYLEYASHMKRWIGKTPTAVSTATLHLWTRIVFNALICNIDDHPRNHGLLQRNGEWELSPAFDLVPAYIRPRENSTLALVYHQEEGNLTGRISAANLVKSGPLYGLDIHAAQQQVIAMAKLLISEWGAVLSEINAPEKAYEDTKAMLEWAGKIQAEAEKIPSKSLVQPRVKAKHGWDWKP